jgi:probable rRNA maturation factor
MRRQASRRPTRTGAATRRRGSGRFVVRVTDARGRPVPHGRGLGAWLADAAPRQARGLVSIALVSDAMMRRLNREYRGVDRATDVLSFAHRPAAPGPGPQKRRGQRAGDVSVPAIEPETDTVPGLQSGVKTGAGGLGPEACLGDLAIATGVARRQARNLGHSLALELRILALHGLLHLLGYDHEADQGEMGRLEDRLRRRAGLPSALIARAARSATRR